MTADLVGIRARQSGRKSEHGPQPGQEFVRTAAFLIARSDIDALLGENDELRAEHERLRAVVEAARNCAVCRVEHRALFDALNEMKG